LLLIFPYRGWLAVVAAFDRGVDSKRTSIAGEFAAASGELMDGTCPAAGRLPTTEEIQVQEFSMAMIYGEAGMRNMPDNAAYDRLEKDVTSVKSDIAALTDQITDAINTFAGAARKQAKRGYKQARAQVDSTVDDMSERSSAMMDAAQDTAYSIEETLEDAIAQRPLATVGLALGLGFLIGVIWRR
jgi:ElaB/YqjD/DUF883 family membrane-anchored ribosome-binding protein